MFQVRAPRNTIQTASLRIIFIARIFCFFLSLLLQLSGFSNLSYLLIYDDDNL